MMIPEQCSSLLGLYLLYLQMVNVFKCFFFIYFVCLLFVYLWSPRERENISCRRLIVVLSSSLSDLFPNTRVDGRMKINRIQ